MKRVMLALAFLSLAAIGGRAVGQVVVPLERSPLGASRTAAFWATQYLYFRSDNKPSEVTKAPEIAGTAYYATMDLGGRPTIMLLDVADTPKLYVDRDRDGDLAEEEPFEGKASGSSGGIMGALVGASRQTDLSFPSLTIDLKNPDATCEVSLQNAGLSGPQRYFLIGPAAVRAGRAEIGGKLREVQVMDATLDGRYDDAFSPVGANNPSSMKWDALFVDADGDGRIMSASITAGEAMPLPQIVSIGGTWYGVKVASDGSSVTFTPADPPMGRLSVGSDQAALNMFSDSGFHHLSKSADGWQLPAGRYQTTDLELVDSVNGTPWSMSASWPAGQLRSFSVTKDETTSIAVGPPLVSDLSFSGSATMQSIGFELKGSGGETYSAGAERRGVMQPAPAFVILDEDGKRLASGSFEYG